MISFEMFVGQLQDALVHLHDPEYLPPHLLCAVLGCDPDAGVAGVQSSILQAIRGFEPDPDAPLASHSKRMQTVLHLRYVQHLKQEDTAEWLDMSVRQLSRVQHQAVYALARTAWNRHTTVAPSEGIDEHGASASPKQEQDWRSQIRQELASLQAMAPEAVSDVGEVIQGVKMLESHILSRRGVHLTRGFVQEDLVAAVHPSVLRQILISALNRLAQRVSTGPITMYAGLEDGDVKITLTGVCLDEGVTDETASTILVPDNVRIQVLRDGERVFLSIRMPAVGSVMILAVDDNPDIVHFYRRATAGTPYRVMHVSRADEALGVIATQKPDAILLDVMLPDMDGWELMVRLRDDPSTRAIPVIVCSVVREEELASSLGASAYLAKPIRPRDLTRTLDRVVAASGKGSTRAPMTRTKGG